MGEEKKNRINEEELIEEDEFESEDDLQESNGDDSTNSNSSDSTSTNEDDRNDRDFVRVEPRTKEERVWKVVDEVRESNYC